MINSVEVLSPRLTVLKLKLPQRRKLSMLQVYAPTSEYKDEEVEAFYDALETTIRECGSGAKIVMGDFNARIGRRQEGERYIGNHGYGERNEAGQRLAAFCESNGLYAGNSYF